MRGRVFLWFSVALNALLLLALWRSLWTPPDPHLAPLPTPTNNPSTIRTNVVVRRLNFVWNQIESDDYAIFIANLRRIGCPEATIRDIVVADINQIFAQRRATEVVTPLQQWWRTDPDPEVASEAASLIHSLETERRTLLAKLLGPDWDSSAYPYPEPSDVHPLDGPILGSLPGPVRAAVQHIERTANQQRRTLLDSDSDTVPTPSELNKIRDAARQSLARLLTPEQLEEYLLRYSTTAKALRTQLRGTTVSPDEFRALFRALDALEAADPTPSPLAGDPAALRESLLKQTLGPARYETMQLHQDPLYRQASSLAEQAGAPDSQIVPLAAILRLTTDEEQRIRKDTTLSPSERLEQLDATRRAQLDSLRQLLGEDAFERFLENHPDLWEKPPR